MHVGSFLQDIHDRKASAQELLTLSDLARCSLELRGAGSAGQGMGMRHLHSHLHWHWHFEGTALITAEGLLHLCCHTEHVSSVAITILVTTIDVLGCLVTLQAGNPLVPLLSAHALHHSPLYIILVDLSLTPCTRCYC